MKFNHFLTGMAAGVLVGSMIPVAGDMMNRNKGRRCVRRGTGRALHTMGDIFDSIADVINN